MKNSTPIPISEVDFPPSHVSRRRFLTTGVLLPATAFVCIEITGRLLSKSTCAYAAPQGVPLKANAAAASVAQISQEDYGVASGSPTAQSVVLWTRLPDAIAAQTYGTGSVYFEIATSAAFEPSAIAAHGLVSTSATVDFTVRVTAENLQPNTRYYYRFSTENGYRSVVGQTHTLPETHASISDLKFATISCQNYEAGYFNVLTALAQEKDLHFVIHLGDTIYERGKAAYTKTTVRPDLVGNGECHTLAEYREKYRLYLQDESLREVRRLFPFVTIWDDHEVANNYEGPAFKQAFPERVKGAYRAFAEYQPISVAPTFLGETLSLDFHRYHSFSFGSLASFFALDLRQYRSHDKGILLGAEQKAWLYPALQNSTCRWNFCLSSVMMMPMQVPDFLLSKNRRSEIRNTPNLDSWDGFEAERHALLTHVQTHKIQNFVVCSGDVHNCFAGTLPLLKPSEKKPTAVGVEFTGGSVTSPNFQEIFGGIKSKILQTAGNFSNPHFAYSEFIHHVYTKFTVTPEKLVVEFKGVESVLTPTSQLSVLKKLVVKSSIAEVVVS